MRQQTTVQTHRQNNLNVAERAMYWNNRSDGHTSIGSPSPDTEWYVPEGFTGSGFDGRAGGTSSVGIRGTNQAP